GVLARGLATPPEGASGARLAACRGLVGHSPQQELAILERPHGSPQRRLDTLRLGIREAVGRVAVADPTPPLGHPTGQALAEHSAALRTDGDHLLSRRRTACGIC